MTTEEEHARATCARKARIGDRRGALLAAARMRKRTGKPIHCYLCGACGWWHTGKKPALVRRAWRKAQRVERENA